MLFCIFRIMSVISRSQNHASVEGKLRRFFFFDFGGPGDHFRSFWRPSSPPEALESLEGLRDPPRTSPGIPLAPPKTHFGLPLGGGVRGARASMRLPRPINITGKYVCFPHRGSGHFCFAPPEERPLSGGVPFLSRKPSV